MAAAFEAGAIAAPDCGKQLPQVLTIGVPRVATISRASTAQLVNDVQATFREIYDHDHAADCGGQRAIRIDIAIGNDYQVLDWLSQNRIDAAIVPDLSIELLRQDNSPNGQPSSGTLDMYEIKVPTLSTRGILLPMHEPAAEARVFHASSNSWSSLPETKERAALQAMAERRYAAFLDNIWQAAVEDDKARDAKQTLILGSHLSTTSFVAAVERAKRDFDRRLRATDWSHDRRVSVEDRLWNEFFRRTHFAVNCANPDACFQSIVDGDAKSNSGDQHRVADGAVAVFFMPEDLAPVGDGGHEEHLLISKAAADRVFGVKSANERFLTPKAHLSPELQSLLQTTPSAFKPLFVPQPAFGTRTYGFTVDEATQLLAQHQAATDANLALVLPGGGVKAVYQTRIIDELYGFGHLANQWATAAEKDALRVRTVVGTSGGALLGYFVSQLDGQKLGGQQLNLSGILWNPDNLPLKSTRIFGATDLLRYVSVVFSLGILCLVLLVSSVCGESGVAPQRPAFRWRSTLTVVLLFVTAPLLIRVVSGTDVEHVPEIEGILYMLMAICVIVSDQAVIYTDEEKVVDPVRDRRQLLYIIGLLCTGLPLIAVPLASRTLKMQLTFSAAFATMTVLVVGGTLAVAAAHSKVGGWLRRTVEILLAIGVVLLACARGLVIPVPPIIVGFALILLGGLEYWYAKSSRRGLQWLISLAAVYCIALLCWPEKHARTGFSFQYLHETAMDSFAAFFLSLGFLLLIVAAALWTARAKHYRVSREDAKALGAAMLTLAGYALAAVLGVAAIAFFFPRLVTPLELTMSFWGWLLIVSVVAALALSIIGAVKPQVLAGLTYLRGAHPNGTLMQRRYGRIFVVALGALLWWNVVEAPALYGNKKALDYRDEAICRFNESRAGHDPAACADPNNRKLLAFTPTARFVTPANLLRTDGTRYFMFLARHDSDDCPHVENPRASGATWSIYRASTIASGNCRASPKETFPGDVAFASGSPFPILPAHVVPDAPASRLDGTEKAAPADRAFVDGGYSNNVPVDAARAVSARQVLIVESTNPLLNDSSSGWTARAKATLDDYVLGRLIINSTRLLPYLFDRSQQVDRLSRNDMFVVSISPSPAHDSVWPPLFDFRPNTVTDLLRYGTEDLSQRIAIVESWGPPITAASGEVDPVTETAPPATKEGPAAPPLAQAHSALHGGSPRRS